MGLPPRPRGLSGFVDFSDLGLRGLGIWGFVLIWDTGEERKTKLLNFVDVFVCYRLFLFLFVSVLKLVYC